MENLNICVFALGGFVLLGLSRKLGKILVRKTDIFLVSNGHFGGEVFKVGYIPCICFFCSGFFGVGRLCNT